MKVIKRDGRIVDYDRSKIRIAIEKANNEVNKKEKATKDDIKTVTEYIEELNKKRILVEDIQDIIEQKLMELGKYELSKRYIVYRYTRQLVRKSNTTDESILGLIRRNNKGNINENSNKIIEASTQRDLIAGEVSKDLCRRILLPEKITKAWEDGILHFHAAEYFIQSICNCCSINIADMLDNGTVINGKMIESPKDFQVACIVLSQIIATVASNQYGGQSIDIVHLGKYLRKSKQKYEKEIKEELEEKNNDELIEKIVKKRLKAELKLGLQMLQYHINTLMTTNGKEPYVTLFLHIDPNEEYLEENIMIIEEVLKQKLNGIKNKEGEYVIPNFPKLVYVIDECNSLNGGKYDYLTKLAIECTAKTMSPSYISAKIMRENYAGNVFSPMGCRNFLSPWKDKNGNYKFEGRFNQGVVTINLPQIAILSEGDEDKFWKLLNERLELCKEALMCRHYALLGTSAEVSPIHWKYGAIARLKAGEKIDNLLYDGYSTLSLGYIGIYEMTKLMKGVSHTEQDGHNFAIKVMQYMKNKTLKWKKETNIGFTLYATPAESLCYRFVRIDKEKFGTIEGINNKGFYTNSFHVEINENMEALDKIKFEAEFQKISSGGAVTYIDITDKKNNLNEIESLVKCIYDNTQYVEFTQKS